MRVLFAFVFRGLVRRRRCLPWGGVKARRKRRARGCAEVRKIKCGSGGVPVYPEAFQVEVDQKESGEPRPRGDGECRAFTHKPISLRYTVFVTVENG